MVHGNFFYVSSQENSLYTPLGKRLDCTDEWSKSSQVNRAEECRLSQHNSIKKDTLSVLHWEMPTLPVDTTPAFPLEHYLCDLAPRSEVDLLSNTTTSLSDRNHIRPWIQNTFFHFPTASTESHSLPRNPNNSLFLDYSSQNNTNPMLSIRSPSMSSTSSKASNSLYGSTLSLNDIDWQSIPLPLSWVCSPKQGTTTATCRKQEKKKNNSIVDFKFKTSVLDEPNLTFQTLPTATTYEVLDHIEDTFEKNNTDAMLTMFLQGLTRGSANSQEEHDYAFMQKTAVAEVAAADGDTASYDPKFCMNTDPQLQAQDVLLSYCKTIIENSAKTTLVDSLTAGATATTTSSYFDTAQLPFQSSSPLLPSSETNKKFHNEAKTPGSYDSEKSTTAPSRYWVMPTSSDDEQHSSVQNKQTEQSLVFSSTTPKNAATQQNTTMTPFKEKNNTSFAHHNKSFDYIASSEPNSYFLREAFPTTAASMSKPVILHIEEPQSLPPKNLNQMDLIYQRSDIQLHRAKINTCKNSNNLIYSKDGQNHAPLLENIPTEAQQGGEDIHPLSCKPCAFHWTKGCVNGKNCQFCHEWHAPKKKKPMKDQKNLMIIARPDGKIEFLRCSVEEALYRS